MAIFYSPFDFQASNKSFFNKRWCSFFASIYRSKSKRDDNHLYLNVLVYGEQVEVWRHCKARFLMQTFCNAKNNHVPSITFYPHNLFHFNPKDTIKHLKLEAAKSAPMQFCNYLSVTQPKAITLFKHKLKLMHSLRVAGAFSKSFTTPLRWSMIGVNNLAYIFVTFQIHAKRTLYWLKNLRPT